MANDGLHHRRGGVQEVPIDVPDASSSTTTSPLPIPLSPSPQIDLTELSARYWSTMSQHHSPPPPPLYQRILLLLSFLLLCHFALRGRAQVWKWKEDSMTELGLNMGVFGDWAEDDVI